MNENAKLDGEKGLAIVDVPVQVAKETLAKIQSELLAEKGFFQKMLDKHIARCAEISARERSAQHFYHLALQGQLLHTKEHEIRSNLPINSATTGVANKKRSFSPADASHDYSPKKKIEKEPAAAFVDGQYLPTDAASAPQNLVEKAENLDFKKQGAPCDTKEDAALSEKEIQMAETALMKMKAQNDPKMTAERDGTQTQVANAKKIASLKTVNLKQAQPTVRLPELRKSFACGLFPRAGKSETGHAESVKLWAEMRDSLLIVQKKKRERDMRFSRSSQRGKCLHVFHSKPVVGEDGLFCQGGYSYTCRKENGIQAYYLKEFTPHTCKPSKQ